MSYMTSIRVLPPDKSDTQDKYIKLNEFTL